MQSCAIHGDNQVEKYLGTLNNFGANYSTINTKYKRSFKTFRKDVTCGKFYILF